MVPSNDAPAAPHQRNPAVVELPVVFLGSFTQEHESLGVRDYLAGVQGLEKKKKKTMYQNLYWENR
jgi:hypothetical protein